jgi:hypothetical protein
VPRCITLLERDPVHAVLRDRAAMEEFSACKLFHWILSRCLCETQRFGSYARLSRSSTAATQQVRDHAEQRDSAGHGVRDRLLRMTNRKTFSVFPLLFPLHSDPR